jgi:hypothetical protein
MPPLRALPLPRIEQSCAVCGAPLRTARPTKARLCRLCAAKRSVRIDWEWRGGGGAGAPAAAAGGNDTRRPLC